MSLVELGLQLLAQRLDLLDLEGGHHDVAPALTRAHERCIHQFHDGALAKGMRDDLGAPALLAEHALEQVGGADRAPMSDGQLEVRNARLEVVLEAR